MTTYLRLVDKKSPTSPVGHQTGPDDLMVLRSMRVGGDRA